VRSCLSTLYSSSSLRALLLLLQHRPAKNQIASAASDSLGQHHDTISERYLAATQCRARDSTEDIPDRPFTPAFSKPISDSEGKTRGGALALVAVPSLSRHMGCHSGCMSM
jgi:hypothetical protein